MEEIVENRGRKFIIIKVIAWCFLIFQAAFIVLSIAMVCQSSFNTTIYDKLKAVMDHLLIFLYLFTFFILNIIIVTNPTTHALYKSTKVKLILIGVFAIIPAIIFLSSMIYLIPAKNFH